MFMVNDADCAAVEFRRLMPFQDIIARVSTRQGGISPGPFTSLNMGRTVGDEPEFVEWNRAKFCEKSGADPERLARLRQVHGTGIHYADAPGFYGEGDGFITDKRGVFLSVHVADCIPLFIYEPRVRVLALLHAGWRGLESGIISIALGRMIQEFSCESGEMVAALGPHIRDCCYSVGEEVAKKFPEESFHRHDNGVYMLSLSRAAVKQLTSGGIPISKIGHDGFCTSCDKNMFFSHRRDKGRTGRMMALFGRK